MLRTDEEGVFDIIPSIALDPAADVFVDCACEHFVDDQRRIVEYLCMHWTSTQLRALQGGYSGSLLFIAAKAG